MLFYFLRGEKYAEYKVMITGKEVNLSNYERMQVSCFSKIPEAKNMLQILCKYVQS